MKLIKFRRMINDNGVWRINKLPDVITDGLSIFHWEIALDQNDLYNKLNGDMAEIIMPAQPFYSRLFRKIFPLKFKVNSF